MLNPQLSIIIPTYNRKNILLKTLDGFKHQTARAGILEILVIDDGSTDGTGAAVSDFGSTSPITIRCFASPRKGQGAARNYGIREAKGALLLFGDDDIIPEQTLVAEHLAWNQRYPADNFAILGHVNWSPEVQPTPFMEWLGLDGVLFGFRRLSPGMEVGIQFFYSCNISIKKGFLVREGVFDESFRAYGYEDVELGYRLVNKGLRILYNPQAIGYHYKHYSYADACRRQEMLCAAMARFETTEADRFLKNQASRAKPMTLKRKLKMVLARAITPFLVPLTPLLDTHLRLPWVVYSLLYFFHVAPRAQARFERSKTRHKDAKEN